MKLSILKPGGEVPLIEQKSDNTNIRKPKIVEKKPYNWGTVFQDKDGDWLSSTQGRVYKDKFGKIYTAKEYEDYIKNGTDEISRFNGMPLVRGLKNVYPEMALAGFVRSAMMGALGSFKNSVTSTVAGIPSRQVKDKLLKGLEQATNRGETINKAVENAAKKVVIKTGRTVATRLPESMRMPFSKAVGRGWTMATSSNGINAQIGAINEIKNK